MKTVILV